MTDRYLSNPRLLDKSRANYRRACKRDPSLPPLLPAAGTVKVTDAVRITLPTVGGKVAYIAVPVTGWRFAREPSPSPVGANAAVQPVARPEAQAARAWAEVVVRFAQESISRARATVAAPEPSDVEVVQARMSMFKALRDEVRAELFKLERQMCAPKAARPSGNVVNINSIAAE